MKCITTLLTVLLISGCGKKSDNTSDRSEESNVKKDIVERDATIVKSNREAKEKAEAERYKKITPDSFKYKLFLSNILDDHEVKDDSYTSLAEYYLVQLDNITYRPSMEDALELAWEWKSNFFKTYPYFNSEINLSEIVGNIIGQELWVQDENSYMRYVNSKTVTFLKDNWIPDPKTHPLGGFFQKFYNKIYARFFRYLKRGELYLLTNTDIDAEAKAYLDYDMENNYAPQYILERFGIPFFDSVEHGQGSDYSSWNSTDVLGFWLRRKIDSSFDAISASVDKILTLYDSEWYEDLKKNNIPQYVISWQYQDDSKAMENIDYKGEFYFEHSEYDYGSEYSMKFSIDNNDNNANICWFSTAQLIDSMRQGTESDEHAVAIYAVGEVLDGPYKGATLIREQSGDQDGMGKFGWEFYTNYTLRMGDSLIIPTLCYDEYEELDNYVWDVCLRKNYPENLNYPDESPYLKGVRYVIKDTYINLVGLTPFGATSDVKSIVSTSVKKVKTILYSGGLSEYLKPVRYMSGGLLYSTAPKYYESFNFGKDELISAESCVGDNCFTLGGYYFLRPDGTAICYGNNHNDGVTISSKNLKSLGSHEITEELTFLSSNSCTCSGRKTEFISRVSFEEMKQDILQPAFLNDDDTVYTVREESGLLDEFYDGVYSNWEAWHHKSSAPSHSQFYSSYPRVFTKDTESWIAWTNSNYLPPVDCEPFIYIYGDKGTKVTVTLDSTIKLLNTDPKPVNNSWEVTLRENGTFNVFDSDKVDHRIFWEGIQGMLPPLDKGWVVARDSLEDFLTDALFQLGLNNREKNEFIEAWKDNLSEKPYCFIGFYPNDMIENYAPMTITPTPDQVIRILMDYRPLDEMVEVEAGEIQRVLRGEGLLVVEWGGLKRFNLLSSM